MRWTMALQDELDTLRKERSAVEKLTTQLHAFEAAMIVLARHKLIVEFADEMNKAGDPRTNSEG